MIHFQLEIVGYCIGTVQHISGQQLVLKLRQCLLDYGDPSSIRYQCRYGLLWIAASTAAEKPVYPRAKHLNARSRT